MIDIESNLNIIKSNIEKSCLKSGRDVNDVTLIAVSKTKPVEYINKAISLGLKDFGENKGQEINDKYLQVSDNINWHMIGHLQTNKVKYIINKVSMIHSVDSIKLAKEINKQSEKYNRIMPILLEVNVADEETKFGIKLNEVNDYIKEISTFKSIEIKGLMTVAPYDINPENNRKYFKLLKEKSIEINKELLYNNASVLSMGMTNDYMVAIEEGATHIRVGSGIFGERIY